MSGMTALVIAVPIADLLVRLGRFRLLWGDPWHLMSGVRSGALLSTAFFVLLADALGQRTAIADPDTVLSFFGLGFMAALLVDRGSVRPALQSSGNGRLIMTPIAQVAVGVAIGAVSHTSLKGAWLVAGTLLLQQSLAVRVTRPTTPGYLWPFSARESIPPLYLAAALAVTAFTAIRAGILSGILGLAAGASVYVSASMLIPESHHGHPQGRTLSMTVASSLLVYGLARFP